MVVCVGYTTIALKPETKKVLDRVRDRLGVRSYDELITILVSEFSRCVEIQVRDRVRKVMCNHFRESSATLSAWLKLLTKELSDVGSIQLAVEFLKPKPDKPDELVVDISKCVEG
jgi:hypothetical protein